MPDPSNLTTNPTTPFVETPYDQWIVDNVFEDEIESYGRYIKDVRKEALTAGKYDEVVEKQLSYNLGQALIRDGLLTQDNEEAVNTKLNSLDKPDLLTSVESILGGDILDPTLSHGDMLKLTGFSAASKVGGEQDAEEISEVSEIVRKTTEKSYLELWKRGGLLAAVYEDEKGNEIFLGGNIPEGMTESEVLLESEKFGVQPQHLFNLRHKRERIGHADDLMRYEVQRRQLAQVEVENIIASRDPKSERLRARMWGLAKEYGTRTTWDWGDKVNNTLSDGFSNIVRGFRISWNGLVGDEEEKDQLLRKERTFAFRNHYAKEHEKARFDLLQDLGEETGFSDDVLDDVIHDMTVAYAYHGGDYNLGANGNIKPFLRYSDNEDELGQNVHRTRYSGALVAQELSLFPEKFRQALVQSGASEGEQQFAEVQRKLSVEANFQQTSKLLRGDDDYADDWSAALISGAQNGLSNTAILENFAQNQDFSKFGHRFSGVLSSIGEGFTSIAYGVAAAFESEWGQEGLLSIQDNNAHARSVAEVFGMEMGAGQDFMEAVGPLVGDAIITAGLALATIPTAGGSAAAGAAYFGAKSAATVSARAIIAASFKGILKTQGKETLKEAAERVFTAGAIKGLSKDRALHVITAYNSQLATRFGSAAAAFIPAATRSGASTYGVTFRTVGETLTAKHKKEDGTWDEGWSEERVKDESHDAALGSALTAGTITGLLTGGFSFFGKGGLEDAFLRGMSFRQLRQITSNTLGRNVGSETFRDLMKEVLKKVTRKHALIEAPKGYLLGALHEGVEEGLDELFNSIVTDVYTNQDTDMFERMTQVWHGFVLGAALGGSGTLISKAAKNIAPEKFLDKGAAARVEQEVFKQYEREVSAKGLTDALKASGSPTTAAEVERVVRQYKRSERPDILEATLSETGEEEQALDETSEVLDEETEAQRQKELDEVNAELQNLSPTAFREEINKAVASKAQENSVDPNVSGSDAANTLIGGQEGDATTGLTDVTAAHAAKNINLELKEEYSQLLEEVGRKEALYKSMEKQLMSASEGSFNNLKRELDMAAREGRAFSPEKAAFLRKEALKRFEENVKLQKKADSKGATKEDSEALDDLANGGFAHTLTLEQLEKLGVSTENIGKPSLRTLTRELAKRIRNLFPIIPTSKPEGGAAIPKIYGPTGSVYVDARGNGVFDNDPVGMLTLLESNIAIPVSRETIQAGGINPSFRFDTRGGQHFISDIMVRESGGLVSARTAFNRVGVLEEDYSQIASLSERLTTLQETVAISEDTKVRNPFNTKSKIKLSTLLKRVKDLGVLRKIIAGDETLNLNKDFLEATAVATSLDMQVAIYEYADSIATGQEVAASPFKVQQIRRTQGGYFARQQVARKKRSTRNLVSVLPPDTDIHETENFNADANSADTYSPPSLSPLPPVTASKVGAYVGALHEVGAAALESDPDMLAEVKSMLNSEVHGGRDVANNYTPEQAFDEFIHFMARGNNVANQRAVDFQAMLKANRFTNAAQVRKSLKLLALSSPSVEGSPSTDVPYLDLVKEELQGLVGEDSKVTSNHAKDFFKDIRKAVGGHQQRAVINGRSMRANEAANNAEIEALGLVDGDPASVIEALEKIVKGKDKKQAAIAALLLSNKDYLQSINFIIDATAAEYSGRFYIDANGTPTVVINPARSGPRGVADTVLHEYIHAFASRILDTPAEARTSAENKAINRIESLLKILRRNANRDNAPPLIRDGLRNVEEFIAIILTSPEFQSYVRGMTPIQGQRNFIQRIVDAFASLFGEPTPTFLEAMQDSLSLTQKVEPENGSGFSNQVASSVNGSQVRRSRLATSIGMGEEVDANEALDNAAEEYFVWAAQYVPPEINIVMDNTTDVIAEWDAETESIIFNGRRAAAKINQIVAAADGRPIRREHILALILNEEVAHVASFAQLSQVEIDALIDALSDTDARRIIEQYYPEGERADAIARLEDPDTAREEKFVLVEEGLRIHVQKVLKGSETNEQIDFLLENPSLLDTVKKYFTTTLKKLTYHRELKDVSPEMRNAVNRIVTEVRAMNAGYRLTPNGMHFDTNNPEATMQQLLKQMEMSNSINLQDAEEADTPSLQSRFGADLWDYPADQEFTAADTSINVSKPPATFGNLATKGVVEFEEGKVNADIGGGQHDNGTELLLEKYGVTNLIYDPWNRELDHNAEVVELIKDGGADTATVNNVLNVIQEKNLREQVILQAANAVGEDGKAYFLMYEGSGDGVGKETSKGWQNNQKAEYYRSEIEDVFDTVERKAGNLLIATAPTTPKLQSRVGSDSDLTEIPVVLNKKGKPITQSYSLLKSPTVLEPSGNGRTDIDPLDFDSLHYEVTAPARQKILAAIESGSVGEATDRLVSEVEEMLKDPSIEAGLGWYSRMRVVLKDALGDRFRLFSHLLGATSAQTPVETNFIYSVEMLTKLENGDYDTNIKSYLELRSIAPENLRAEIESRGFASASKLKKATTTAKLTKLWLNHYKVLPRRDNGKLYGANSLAALKAITDTWLEGKLTPKTPQFAMNLNGDSLEATIDVWAARTLRRILWGDKVEQWRIQPKAEIGVSNEDFALGQVIFREAAKTLDMSPDDLQAIVWFGEKDVWNKNGWTKEIGAFKSSFDEAAAVFFPSNEPPRSLEHGKNIVKFLQKERLALSKLDVFGEDSPQLKKALKEYEKAKGLTGIRSYVESRGREPVAELRATSSQGEISNERDGQTDRSGSAGDVRGAGGRVTLQSRWGAGSYIPSELDADGVDFSEWVEMLELPLMEVGTYKSPSKWWSRALLGYADRNIMRFKEERDAFVSTAKKKVEDFKEKHDRIVADAASNDVEIPPELVSRASGSNKGSQLSDAQTKSVENQWLKERSAASRETVAKRREELRNLAETNRIANTKKLRDQNHAELLMDRDAALKSLLVISPEMHSLILTMRKLTDELSQIGNSLFSGFLNRKEEFKATFDGNGGIYVTRRYRMFEDNDFVKDVREEGGKYSKEREEAMLFFAAQYMDYHTKRVMRSEAGLSEAQARANVERDLATKSSSGRTEGKKMMEEFIKSYEKNAVKHELEVYAGADGGRSIIMNEKKFEHGPLRALVNNLNEKKDIPAPLRRLLGEYGDEAGVDNLNHTIMKVASIMSNQAFFNRVVEHGTTGKTPWLISEEDYNKDQQQLESEQKYSGWTTLKPNEGMMDWNPLKGFYAAPDIIQDFIDLNKLNTKDSVTEEVTGDAEYILHTITKFLHRATGLSLAAKTLGSVGFYVRNMLGNAMFFGPMQGYYGGIGKMFGEIGGVAGVNSVLRENSMIVRAARGSSAQLSAELAVLETLNVWGDEMEASMLRDLLTGKETSVSVEDKLAGLAKNIGKLKEKGAKAKDAYDKTVRLATRMASAMDAYYKIGLYEYELSVLEEAAHADGPNGKYRRLLKKNEDGELVPSTSMKRAAAIKVKKVSQSYSQAPPIIKALTRNPAGLVFAPYVRFAAEIPRITGNTFSLLAEEKREGKNNPVIRKRYLKRLWGMMSTMGATFALPILLRTMAEIGADEDEALRKGMPSYLRGHTFYYLRVDGELYSLDLTYLNPFSVLADPVARSMEQLVRGEPAKAAGWIARLAEPYVSEQILAKAAFQVGFNKNEYGQKIMYGEDYAKNLGRAFNHIWEKAYEPRSVAKLHDAWRALHGDPTPADNAMDWLFKSPMGMIFGELLPVKPYKVDLGNAMRNYLRQHTSDYKEIGSKFNRLLSPKDLTDGEITAIYDNVYNTKLDYNNEFRKIMRGFNGLGVEWGELSAQALSRGVSKERWGQNFNGWMNRPVLSKFLEKKLNATDQGAERVYKIRNHAQKYERYIGLDD